MVSLVPSVTESLFELGVGNRLVGITDYCVHPAQEVARLPRIGGTKNPDIARIIEYAKKFIAEHPMENAQFKLAGGLIGVLAAANDELVRNDLMMNALGFGTMYLICLFTYRSAMAGMGITTCLTSK